MTHSPTTAELLDEIDVTIEAFSGAEEYSEAIAMHRVIRARVEAHDALVSIAKGVVISGTAISPTLKREARAILDKLEPKR